MSGSGDQKGNPERAILELFARRYPASAMRRGGRALRLREWAKLLPEWHTSLDARLAFLDAMEALQHAGIISVTWKGKRTRDEVESVTLVDAGLLYSVLGVRRPEDVESKVHACAMEEAAKARARGDACAARALEAMTSFDGIDETDVLDASSFFAVPDEIVASTRIRALSARLYRDTKRLEELLPVLERSLSIVAAGKTDGEFSARQDSRVETRSDESGSGESGLDESRDIFGGGREGRMLPVRSFPEVAVAGRVRLVFEDETSWILGGKVAVLPLGTVLRIKAIVPESSKTVDRPNDMESGNPGSARAIVMENKETFHVFSDRLAPRLGFDLVVACGGRLNRAVTVLLCLLAKEGWAVSHSGDLDPDGIAILGEVHRVCGALPYRMDVETFNRYRAYGRKLDAHVTARTSLIDTRTLALPGIPELVMQIARSGIGVEQEIIDYTEP